MAICVRVLCVPAAQNWLATMLCFLQYYFCVLVLVDGRQLSSIAAQCAAVSSNLHLCHTTLFQMLHTSTQPQTHTTIFVYTHKDTHVCNSTHKNQLQWLAVGALTVRAACLYAAATAAMTATACVMSTQMSFQLTFYSFLYVLLRVFAYNSQFVAPRSAIALDNSVSKFFDCSLLVLSLLLLLAGRRQAAAQHLNNSHVYNI